jgi:hypothetical protein
MDFKSPEAAAGARQLQTKADVAERFNVSPRTVGATSFLRRLGLRKIKIGRAVRFDPDDVEAAIERARCPGCGDE